MVDRKRFGNVYFSAGRALFNKNNTRITALISHLQDKYPPFMSFSNSQGQCCMLSYGRSQSYHFTVVSIFFSFKLNVDLV